MFDYKLLWSDPQRLLPFLAWIASCKQPKVLQADVLAGITVALVLVPQSMAYAQLAGLPPYYGLYASFLPGIVAALFGSSRQLATGPIAVVSLMTAAALEPLECIARCIWGLCEILWLGWSGCFSWHWVCFEGASRWSSYLTPWSVVITNAAAIIIAS